MRLALATLALLCLALAGCGGDTVNQPHAASAKFSMTSPAFGDNSPIPAEYSCKGRNVPPTLRWQNVPAGTQSLALLVDDPDAPGGDYVHWVVIGIPPTTTELSEGPLPAGASVGLNSGGKAEYLGPCPPAGSGVHHYRFQLYALREPLDLGSTAPAQQAVQTIRNAATATAGTVGLFGG